MYNNFTNTLIYKHFHILNTSTLFICNNHTNILDPHCPQLFTFTPTPIIPHPIFFLFLKNSNTSYPLLFIHSLYTFSFFSFPQISKLPPLNYFYLILFFFFLQITHISYNFLYNAIYILCLLFVLLYVYSFVITHFRGVYGYSNMYYISTTCTRCILSR